MANSSQGREGFKARRAAKRAADPEVQKRAADHERRRRQAAAKAARELNKAAKDKLAQVHEASK